MRPMVGTVVLALSLQASGPLSPAVSGGDQEPKGDCRPGELYVEHRQGEGKGEIWRCRMGHRQGDRDKGQWASIGRVWIWTDRAGIAWVIVPEKVMREVWKGSGQK